MPTEETHDVPGHGQVNVLDLDSAAAGLGVMLQRFRKGDRDPLIFGEGKPEGVVIAFDEWLELLDAEEDRAISERVMETTRQRLDTPREEYIPIEELGLDLDDVDPRQGKDG